MNVSFLSIFAFEIVLNLLYKNKWFWIRSFFRGRGLWFFHPFFFLFDRHPSSWSSVGTNSLQPIQISHILLLINVTIIPSPSVTAAEPRTAAHHLLCPLDVWQRPCSLTKCLRRENGANETQKIFTAMQISRIKLLFF